MNRNLSIIILTVAVVAGLLFFAQSKGYLGNFSIQPKVETKYQTEMSGNVVSVKDNLVTIEGSVSGVNKSIVFSVTPRTVLVNGSNTITEEQIKSGKNFQPTFVKKDGKLSDLVPKMIVSMVRSQDNLFTTNSTTAVEIDYVTLNVPIK